jgi:glycosyltransferase involved in cell wall biosynthesis
VLLPAFNEAANIGRVVGSVLALRIPDVEITALVVNDGSADDTARLAATAGARVLSHERNRGVGAAFRTGLDFARQEGVEFLAHMDSDGQLLATDIPRVLLPVQLGLCDLALGSRFVKGTAPPAHFARWKGLALGSVSQGVGFLTGYELSDISCGLRCMNRTVIEAIRPSVDYDYIQETLLQALAARVRICDVPVTALYEAEGNKGMSGRTLRYSRRFLKLVASGLFQFYSVRGREYVGSLSHRLGRKD